MHGIAEANRKKKLLIGVGLAVLIVATLIIGIYVTNRAGANESSVTVSSPEETDMYIDARVESIPTDLEALNDSVGSDGTSAETTQQGETSSTDSNVQVRVNGAPIDVSKNESIHKEIHTENGSTRINISSQSSGSSNDSTQSSINIKIDSSAQVQNE